MRATGWRCVALAGLAAVGCKKESGSPGAGGMGGEPIAAASTDPLWAFAPPDATVAVVVADGVLEPTYRGALAALTSFEKIAGAAELTAGLRQKAKTPLGDLLDRATLDAFGIDLKKGMAFFESPSARVAVLPVGDPAKFAGKLGAPIDGGVVTLGPMTCKTVSDRFLCGDSPAALEAGSKGGGGSRVAGWPREMRGHIELFVAASRLGDDMPVSEPEGLRASAVLERGAITARVHLVGKPVGPVAAARSGKSDLVAGVADQQPSGIVLVNAAGLWKLARAKAAAAPAKPLPGGITTNQLVTALSGEAIGYALPGMPLRGIGKIGLESAEPVNKLLAACGEFAAMAPAGVTVDKKGARCSVSIDLATATGTPMPGVSAISFEAWVESNALVIGAGQHAATSSARPGLAPFARAILDGNWLFAAWGQGSAAGAPLLLDQPQLETALKSSDKAAGMAIWAMYHLSELGVAGRVADDGIHGLLRVRTLWANPDEVVSAVEDKIAAFAGGDAGAMTAMVDLAKKFPGTPFARDVDSGAGGLMAPVALAGVLAAVSITAFLKYRRRGESVEARMNLRKMQLGARESRMGSSDVGAAPRLPSPSAGPVPPLGTCCQQGGTCQPNAAWWSGEPWRSLEFSVDEPHRYSYEYKIEPGERSYTVLAYGDLDCDGAYSTFSMRGSLDPSAPGTVTGDDELTRVDEDE